MDGASALARGSAEEVASGAGARAGGEGRGRRRRLRVGRAAAATGGRRGGGGGGKWRGGNGCRRAGAAATHPPPLAAATSVGLELTGQVEARAWRAEPRALAALRVWSSSAGLTRLELELRQLRRHAGRAAAARGPCGGGAAAVVAARCGAGRLGRGGEEVEERLECACCWRHRDEEETQSTVYARQRWICIWKMALLVGVSLSAKNLHTPDVWNQISVDFRKG